MKAPTPQDLSAPSHPSFLVDASKICPMLMHFLGQWALLIIDCSINMQHSGISSSTYHSIVIQNGRFAQAFCNMLGGAVGV
jgi:hypothetical protein